MECFSRSSIVSPHIGFLHVHKPFSMKRSIIRGTTLEMATYFCTYSEGLASRGRAGIGIQFLRFPLPRHKLYSNWRNKPALRVASISKLKCKSTLTYLPHIFEAVYLLSLRIVFIQHDARWRFSRLGARVHCWIHAGLAVYFMNLEHKVFED